MLTVNQVRNHSELFVGSDAPDTREYVARYFERKDYYLTKVQVRFLYFHNERASSFRMTCPLSERIFMSRMRESNGEQLQDQIADNIDWERFTKWINDNDDLNETNLVSKEEWISLNYAQTKKGLIGRNGEWDTIRNRRIDRNKIILE